jgi:hypothetical protein
MAAIRLLVIGAIGGRAAAKHHLPHRKDENGHANKSESKFH